MNTAVNFMKKNMFVLIIIISILCISFAGCVIDLPNAEIVQNLRTKRWYLSIQDAIDAAQPNDIILVYPGVYNEHLSILKTLTIKSTVIDPIQTTIQGNNSKDVIYIQANNVTIEGFTISGGGASSSSDVYGGIHIRSDHTKIRNCLITDNYNYGIYLYDAHNNTINDCIIHSNDYREIYVYSCSGNRFENNTINADNYGLYGIIITDSILRFNTLSNAESQAVYFGRQSKNNLLKDNIIQHNNYGFYIQGAVENTFTDNLFINNTRGMFFCCGGRDNLIYKNTFINNQEHAYGIPINMFYKDITGNYWDDYNGTDENNDGRGDTPYLISCGTGYCNQDDYPLMKPE